MTNYHIVGTIDPSWYPQDDSKVLCISRASADKLAEDVHKQQLTFSSAFNDLQKSHIADALEVREYHVSIHCPNPLAFKPYESESTQIVLARVTYDFVEFYYVTEG